MSGISPAQRMLIDAEDVAHRVTKINLRGRLDATAVEAITPMFDRITCARRQLIVDLSRVSFIAPRGRRTLISAWRRVTASNASMVLRRPEPSFEAVLIASGTEALIPICQDLAAALDAVGAGEFADDNPPNGSLSFSVDVERSVRGAARAGAWVEELAMAISLARRMEQALRLCLKEAVTSIVTDALPVPGVNADAVSLRLIAAPDRLSVTLEDQCAAFNPLRPDPTAHDRARPREAGLGVSLLSRHARDVTWSRVGTANRLAFAIPRQAFRPHCDRAAQGC